MNSWTERAMCLDVDVNRMTFGDAKTSEMNQFIHDYCEVCPVAQQCLDSAFIDWGNGITTDDLEFTVRGGYLPTRAGAGDRGRPRGGKTKPIPDDVFLDCVIHWMDTHKGNMCVRGHVVEDELSDLRVRRKNGRLQTECKACIREDDNGRYERKSSPTHCRNGHFLTDDNSVIRDYKKNGRLYSNRRCLDCRRASERNRAKIAS